MESGTNLDGYEILRDAGVRFVLIGGSEVSVHSILTLLDVHAVGFGLALVALTAAAWRLRRPEPEPVVRSATTPGALPD